MSTSHAGGRKQTVERIYAALFDRIVNSEYAQGTWLREDAVAHEFGVSRSPIRAVFQQLELDGMLELVPNRGARVYPFTADDVEEIYEIRKALESLALSLGMQNLSIHRLLLIKKQIVALADNPDPKEHAKMDGELHSYLIECSGRRRLVTIINGLYLLINTLRERGLSSEEVRRRTMDEHCGILDALTARDLEHATGLLVEHIENSKARLLTDVIRSSVR